jgi:hypothetical protein
MRSVNQNHHLYVAKYVGDSETDMSAARTGTIRVKSNRFGEAGYPDIWFEYKGWDGVVRSDLIPINQITYMKRITAEKMESTLKGIALYLDPDIHTDS